MRIKTGDMVMVRSGKHKGKTGKVISVHPKENKLRVEGVNVVKRHMKPTQSRPQGGVLELTKPIWVSKVGLLDNSAKKPSRVGYKTDAKGNKSRFLKTSGKEVK
ncbi:MAG TPA: 50S ribosomal protein L24 [Candidatus Saccharimonadales bacterium]|nr:50S ribosomal protein L24 [Candidatus Saccharimonadales bacterium]